MNVIQRFVTAQQATVQSDFKTIVDGLKLYRLDNGRYPVSSPRCGSPRRRPTLEGPLRRALSPVIDPWGTPYVYTRSASAPRLPAHEPGRRRAASGGADEDADIEHRVE
ncbi:MAG: type II secretion system protein GspG [Planctomycetota bacterium]